MRAARDKSFSSPTTSWRYLGSSIPTTIAKPHCSASSDSARAIYSLCVTACVPTRLWLAVCVARVCSRRRGDSGNSASLIEKRKRGLTRTTIYTHLLLSLGELHPEYKERSSGLVAQGRRCCARSGWRKSQLVVVRVSPRSKLSLVRAP